MLASKQEDVQNVIAKLINVYEQDFLPKSHQNFLLTLKTDYNFTPKVCYDIGACVLHWTRHAERLWPTTQVVLFDAFAPVEMFYKNYTYNIGVLSDVDDKEIKFYQNDLFVGGNSYYREIGCENGKYFPEDAFLLKKTRTVDSLAKEHNYPYPDLIKIDVQGAELDVLKGMPNVLSHAKFLLVELQHVEYNKGAPTVAITKPYLESIGWQCIAEKFSDNGPDADYCFFNTNYKG